MNANNEILIKQEDGGNAVYTNGYYQTMVQPLNIPLGCARCGHVNDGSKRKRRFYMMEEFPNQAVCGTCVHKVRPNAKAT